MKRHSHASQPFHVLFLTFHIPGPDEAGAARPWEELQLMRELGWKVTVVTCAGNYLTGDVEGPPHFPWRTDVEGDVRTVRVWCPRDFKRSLARRAGCYLAFISLAPLAGILYSDVDAVFSSTDPPFTTAGAYALARAHGARLVLDERDLLPDAAEAAGVQVPRWLSTGLSKWTRFVRARCTGIVTVSPTLGRLLAQRGARPDRTFVVPNYFPEEGPGKDESLNRVIPRQRFVVVYAGTLGPSYDVCTCIEAARILAERGYSAIHFDFWGAGSLRDEYITYVKKIGLDNVAFPGSFGRHRLGSILSEADIGLLALGSHPYWRCALSSKLFEYMAAGKPVVFAGEGDIADVLNDAGAGLAVPPESPDALADAIVKLYDSPEKREAMGRSAMKYIRESFRREEIRTRLAAAFSAPGNAHEGRHGG